MRYKGESAPFRLYIHLCSILIARYMHAKEIEAYEKESSAS